MSTLSSPQISAILNIFHTNGTWFLKNFLSQLPSYFWNSVHVLLGERELEFWIYLCIMTLPLLYMNINILLLLKKHDLCKEMKALDRHMYVYLHMNVYACEFLWVAEIPVWS